MSSGTPKGGGLMRQRHSQGYASSGDDLEDDACSRMAPPTAPIPRARTWIEVVENVLWIGSATFIIYFGDRRSNLIYLLWHDDRIRRTPLYLGMVGIVLNAGVFFYTSLVAWGLRKSDEKWEVLTPSVAPLVTLIGLSSFGLSLKHRLPQIHQLRVRGTSTSDNYFLHCSDAIHCTRSNDIWRCC